MGPLTKQLIECWPTAKFNTLLYIYGEEWPSVTQALGVRLMSEDKTVISLTGNEFLENLIAAVKSGTIMAFRDSYIKPDVLILKNLSEIQGKCGVQEQLYIILDKRTERGMLNIVSDPNPPRDYKYKINDRILSILEGYLMVDTRE